MSELIQKESDIDLLSGFFGRQIDRRDFLTRKRK